MRTKVITCVISALIFVAILTFEVPKEVSAQLTEEWVARYNGPGNYNDGARSIDVDPSGNIYVTGSSQGNGTDLDFATISYDPNGNLRWLRRYNGPGNNKDECHSMVLDQFGNIYVIGSSHGGPDTLLDYATIKYDSNGNELWVARYNGSAKGHDSPQAITIGPSGNIYVTGEGVHGDIGHSYTTVAYNQDGNELWVARYRGNGTNFQRAYDVTIDTEEIIYVTGLSSGDKTKSDIATVAYDSSGNELWVARYNGPGNGHDIGRSITIGSSGNVFVAGSSFGIGTHGDITTIAYNSSGYEIWLARYAALGYDHDWAQEILLDSSDNVHVTGRSQYDYATIKYDSSGNELWVATYNGPGNGSDEAYALALDSTGNVYVSGSSEGSGTNKDYATIIYDSSGNQIWLARYNGLGNYYDYVSDISLDSFGNLYVTGGSDGNGTERDFATIKYSKKEPIIQAIIDIDPDTLNLKSKGNWITCYIDLPGNDVNEIDISTILLEDTIPAEWGDIQGDTLMVKFDRSEVEDMLVPGTYNLKVTGEMVDGTGFEGYSDEVRVIDPP